MSVSLHVLFFKLAYIISTPGIMLHLSRTCRFYVLFTHTVNKQHTLAHADSLHETRHGSLISLIGRWLGLKWSDLAEPNSQLARVLGCQGLRLCDDMPSADAFSKIRSSFVNGAMFVKINYVTNDVCNFNECGQMFCANAV